MKKVAGFFLNIFPRSFLIRLSLKLMPFVDILMRGKNFYDPINQTSYRMFFPYGYGKQRANALSPGTFSLERHRQLWLYLKNETDFFTSHLKVLHIAPEQCFIQRFRNMKNLEYITTDLYSPIVDVKADICALPFPDEAFDVVLCNHVLEHIPDDAQAMKEIFRVMKKGGWGIVQVPLKNSLMQTEEDLSITDPKIRAELYGQYDHVRQYGMDYQDRWEAVGCQIEMLKYSQKYSVEDQNKMGLRAEEILPVIRKS